MLNDISKVVYFKKLVKILYNLAKPDFFEEVWIIRFFALKWKADKNLWLGQNCLTNYLTSQDYNLRIIVQNYTHVEALESRFHKLSKDTKTTQWRPWLVEKTVLGRNLSCTRCMTCSATPFMAQPPWPINNLVLFITKLE